MLLINNNNDNDNDNDNDNGNGNDKDNNIDNNNDSMFNQAGDVSLALFCVFLDLDTLAYKKNLARIRCHLDLSCLAENLVNITLCFGLPFS